MPKKFKVIKRRGKSAVVRTAQDKLDRKREAQEQAKMNIKFESTPGRKTKAIGTRKVKVSGGRGKMLKRKSKTGYVTGGGF